jgi:citrate synthase
MVASVAAGLAALKGPLHGGAPGPALAMMETIERRMQTSGRGLEVETEAYVRETVAGGGRLMGLSSSTKARPPRRRPRPGRPNGWRRIPGGRVF